MTRAGVGDSRLYLLFLFSIMEPRSGAGTGIARHPGLVGKGRAFAWVDANHGLFDCIG